MPQPQITPYRKAELTEYGTMSLGALINALESTKDDALVYFDFCGFTPGEIDSYRGYYDHLAIEPLRGVSAPSVAQFISSLRDCEANTYTGYKGGDYTMDLETPIWVSFYGSVSGTGIVSIDDQGCCVILVTANID